MRLGLAVPTEGLSLRESVELAVRAERLGYTDAWSYEVNDSDGFTPLGWLAARTQSMRFGISLVPAFTRPPALLGMACAALQDLSEGRFVLGLGSSSPNVVEKWMGGTHERPMQRVRETVEALRLVLSGEKVNYTGETLHVADFRLALPPQEVPIMLGALGPKTFRMAGELGDGVITVFHTPEGTDMLLEDFRAGAREAGKDPDTLDVASKLFVAVDEDDEDFRAMQRRFITGYGTVPAYNRLLARQGFGTEAAEMAAAWEAGDRKEAAAVVSDELLERLLVFGSADECAARIREFADHGVKTMLIAPTTAAQDPDERRRRVTRTMEALAERLTA